MRTFSTDPDAGAARDLSGYRLRAGDFVHAALSLIVFATLALLDRDTVSCLYPALEAGERTMMAVLPPVVGGVLHDVPQQPPRHRLPAHARNRGLRAQALACYSWLIHGVA
uniref:Uncharacterized protein n=1 Tax=Aegilops tauschii TaxID=37682 RepID=R7W791_AEGTA